jgi:Fe-S cluster assembly protein SufD
MIKTSDGVGVYREAFDGRSALRAAEPAWLRETRDKAMGAFERLGFPTTRDEDWRFTNIQPVAAARFPTGRSTADVSAAQVWPCLVPGVEGAVVVFVDGRFSAKLSRLATLPAGTFAGDLAAALKWNQGPIERHLAAHAPFDLRALTSLNTALFADAAVVAVPDGAVVEEPVQLLFLSSADASRATHPRALILAGENSQLRLVETYASLGSAHFFTNAVTEVVAADGAVVDHYRLQRESDHGYHVGMTQFRVGRSASVSSHSVTLGGLISRHDAVAVLAGEGADCTLNGVYLADGRRLVDNHTEIEHAMPHGTSHEVYKGILDGRARAVFNGRIRVRPDAQKTDAKQTNKTLLLSDEAQINTKPQLEILANDVKCTHGATVGQLSEDALFYLRARGIGREEARALLVKAFLSDVVSKMKLEPVRTLLDALLDQRLPGAAGRRAAS